jgi:hypothetical protein
VGTESVPVTPYDIYELIDEFGQEYYRWNGELQIMEWFKDGEWVTHGWTPASLMRYRDAFADVSLSVVTEDDVR